MPDRFAWALETMAVAPDDTLLEIGCGYGAAVSLVCERLDGGRIVAIDRSRAMIERAAARNRGHVEAGRATLYAVALEDADLGEQFDKAFAVNVHLLRDDPEREADALRRLLRPEGTLFLFQQHPSAARTQRVTDELRSALERHGLVVREVTPRSVETSS